MMGRIEMVGRRFGKLVVVAPAEYKDGRLYWRCHCDCGKDKVIWGDNLRRGLVKSCGCLRATKGGIVATPMYRRWSAMVRRCHDSNNKAHANYGARGIAVCDSWRESFENFWADMSESYREGLSLDRIDNDKGYYKENCRWADAKTQSRNRRDNVVITTPDGEMTVSEAASRYGLLTSTLASRVRRGDPSETWFRPTK